MTNKEISLTIEGDIQRGMYTLFPSLEKRLQRIAGYLLIQNHQLSRVDRDLLYENEYLPCRSLAHMNLYSKVA